MVPFKSYVVNLTRRPDRYERFIGQNLPFHIERFEAVDGKTLTSTSRLRSLFQKNDYQMRRGIVGCALSHIKLALQLLQEPDVQYYIIFEDDAVIPDGFKDQYQVAFQGQDITFFNTLWRRPDPREGLLRYNSTSSLYYSIGGTGAYVINKQGARRLLEYIDKHSMTNAIDTMMQKAADTMDIRYVSPSIVHMEDSRSEIQHDFDTSLDQPGKLSSYRIFGGDLEAEIGI